MSTPFALAFTPAAAPGRAIGVVWPDDWIHFARLSDLVFAVVGLVLGVLLLIWWAQQTRRWYSVFAATLLISTALNVGSFYLFVVPPHQAGCPDGCAGRIGYPLPYATISLDGTIDLFLIDFLLNLLLLWLLWLGATVLWRLLSVAFELSRRSLRYRILFVLAMAVLPWALLPRYFEPPQPEVQGEELRLAVNARRVAETTYNVTGVWVQRLALEDIRYMPMEVPNVFGGIDQPQAQVCLRGYIYFYLPWRRYRITLDRAGVTALHMAEVPLGGSCWQ